METGIISIGIANPDFKRPQIETAELIAAGLKLNAVEKRLLKSVYKSTGIAYRHSVLPDYVKSPGEFEFFPNDPREPYPSTFARMQVYKANALPLSLLAINHCLAALPNFNKKDITHLITVSCTGMYAPGIDIEIVQYLQLNSSTMRTNINFMGCYGAFNGIKVADSICKADANAKVLLVCVEICTIHFQKKMNIDNVIANSIFADGAAAVLIQANPTPHKYLGLKSFFCDIVPQSTQEMAWQISDHGFDIVLSTYVPEVIRKGIAIFSQTLLSQYGITWSEIDFYAIHPGGIKILEACEKSLSIDKEMNHYAYQILRNYGNMSSATVLFMLKAIWEDVGTHDHNKNIFCCAFGPGLTLESMILKIVF